MIQIAALESKINSIPNVKVALESINTQYQSAKETYDDLLKKKNNAELMVGVESNAQGETIRVQDPANLPSSPANASKKPMLVVVGAGIGLAIGLFLAGLFEVPRLFTIQSIEDAKHYTGLAGSGFRSALVVAQGNRVAKPRPLVQSFSRSRRRRRQYSALDYDSASDANFRACRFLENWFWSLVFGLWSLEFFFFIKFIV